MDNPHNKFPGGASGHKRVSKSGEIGSKLFGERSGIGKQFSGKKRISKSDEMLERIHDSEGRQPVYPAPDSGSGKSRPGCGSGCCALPFLLMLTTVVCGLIAVL